MNVTFTPQAADAIRRYIAAHDLGPKAGLRITVEGPDRYSLAVVRSRQPTEVKAVADGVRVFTHQARADGVGTVVIDGGLRRGEPRLRLIAVAPGDDPGYSSRPGRLRPDYPMLARLQPDLFRPGTADPYPEMLGEIAEIARQLNLGDCNAAVVLSTRPFRVAAYADEMDCVAVLDFPPELSAAHHLGDGSRLVAVNFYERNVTRTASPTDRQIREHFGPDAADLGRMFPGQKVEVGGLTVFGAPAADLAPGRKNTGRWQNFGPLIADLLTADRAALADRKARIPADDWARCEKFGAGYARVHPGVCRDGRPMFCRQPRHSIGGVR